jgi:hypothetical protein
VTPRAFVSWFAFAALAVAQAPAAPKHAPFEVKGRAVTWDGHAIAGARVELAPLAQFDVAEVLRTAGASTAADGTFTLTVPPAAKAAGDRVVVLAAKGFASCVLRLPAELPATAAAKQPWDLGEHALAPGQRIAGRVRDAAGAPVVGARVTAVDLLSIFDGVSLREFVCAARTGPSGIFDLPGALPAGSSVRVEADGFYTAIRQPVAAGTPLEFELEPSGFLVGQVRDAAGRGIGAAGIRVIYESDTDGEVLHTDAQGGFRATVRHPGRWRVSAWTDDRTAGSGHSRVGSGPAADVTIVLPVTQRATPRKLTVQATRKGSTEGVRALRAVATWSTDLAHRREWLRFWFAERVHEQPLGVDGRATVDGPDEEGQPGAVYVVAEGCAPLLQCDVAWDEKNPTLAVELEPEASVRGVVRDAASGTPIAGARVLATQVGVDTYGFSPASQPEDDTMPRSGADGTFRIGQLGEGEWQIWAVVDGRPAAKPLPITLRGGESHEGVRVDVPLGARVAGRLVGAQLAPGCRVSLQAVAVGSGHVEMPFVTEIQLGPGGDSARSGKSLAADGSFAFEGQALGHYTLLLHLPVRARSGASLCTPIDSFRLRAAGIEREFDIAGDRARTLRGKLTFPGAATAFEHLLVVAMPAVASAWTRGWTMPGAAYGYGARTIAARDGSFALEVMPGDYHLKVVDLAMGIEVAASKAIEVGAADVQADVAVPLVQVTLELHPASGSPMATLGRIELRSQLASQRLDGTAIELDDRYDSGQGVRVPRGATSLTLALPHADIVFFARSNVASLHVGGERTVDTALGRLELSIPGDHQKKVVLEVAPPPEIPEPAADAAKDEKGGGGR